MDTDFIIIGGGPAGVSASLRARELGARVILIERENLGGTCLHRGCVPTVTAVEVANRRLCQVEGQHWGLANTLGTIDLTQVARRRDEVVRQVYSAVSAYVRQAEVDFIKGSARLVGANTVEVEEANGRKIRLSAPAVLLAVGASFILPQIPGIDHPGVWTTDHCLDAKEIPGHIAVYGGNFIGIEWAQFFHALGSQVTILEPGPQLLPGEDAEVAEALQFLLAESGIEVRLNCAALELTGEARGRIGIGTPGGSVMADRFLVSDPRRPRVAEHALGDLGIAIRDGAVSTDERQATSIPGVFAAGDITGGRMLSQVARTQGIVAAEAALGMDSRFDPTLCPRVYHVRPEVAAVGLTEAEALDRGVDIVVGRSEVGYNARALTLGQGTGLVKIVAARPHGKVLGVHILGPLATEAIAAAALALRLEALAEDLASLIHGHPTIAESVAEAAWDALQRLR